MVNYAGRTKAAHALFMQDNVLQDNEVTAHIALSKGKSGKMTKSSRGALVEAYKSTAAADAFESPKGQARLRDALIGAGATAGDLGIEMSPALKAFNALPKAKKLDRMYELVDTGVYDGFIEFGTVHIHEPKEFSRMSMTTATMPAGMVKKAAAKELKQAKKDAKAMGAKAYLYAHVKDGETYGYTIELHKGWRNNTFRVFDHNMKSVGELEDPLYSDW